MDSAASSQSRLIQQSHQRCEALGLSRIERPEYEPLSRSDVALTVERSQRLYAHAAPVMELLLEQIAGTDSMIVLTDAQGTILHSLGDDDFLARAGKVALTPGVSWAENSKGTNAIGTALFEEAPTLVHAGQHFMHANSFLTCSAAPIFDPRGGMLGVLDVSGDHRSYHQHTMGLVRMSARMIENHWLSDDCSTRLRLHFHRRPEFIGSLLEGIIVVSTEGRITGSNRSALDQLGLSAVALRQHTLASLLGCSVDKVMDHFRSPQAEPMQLALSNGQALHLTARFIKWGARPVRQASPKVALAPPAVALLDALPRAAPNPPSAAGQAAPAPWSLHELAAGDTRMGEVVAKVQRVLDRGIPLLLLGETGCGKEVLARATHEASQRRLQAFVRVSCTGLSEPQAIATLFGHDDPENKGEAVAGCLRQARGGTLLLDEVGDLPARAQAQLLQVLQDGHLCSSGGRRGPPLDVALICTSQRDLRQLIDQAQFRQDLYYRLNGLSVRLPALRDRNNLPLLAQRILALECPEGAPALSTAVLDLLQAYPWPGNLRQLTTVLRIAAAMAAGESQILASHLPDEFLDEVNPAARAQGFVPALAAPDAPSAVSHTTLTLKDAEREAIRKALDEANGNVSAAARQLGICRNTIYRKLLWQEHRPPD